MIIIPTSSSYSGGLIYPGSRIVLNGNEYMYMGLNESSAYAVLSWRTNTGNVMYALNRTSVISQYTIAASLPNDLLMYLHILTILQSRH